MTARQTRGNACPLVCKLAAIAFAALGCNLPVHLTQSPHILIYNQWFVFCANQGALQENLINEMFNIPPEYAPHLKDVEKIAIHGSVYFRIISVPGDPSAFTIDGHGWHRMFYGMTHDNDASEYLASADYRIVNDGPIYVEELRRASLIMTVKILNKAYFSQQQQKLVTVQGGGSIFLKIFLKRITEDVYTLDFNREHIVGVGPPISLDARGRIQPIGYMKFIPPSDERNMWDFRRAVPIATDYATMMTARIGKRPEQPDFNSREWLPESSCQGHHQGT